MGQNRIHFWNSYSERDMKAVHPSYLATYQLHYHWYFHNQLGSDQFMRLEGARASQRRRHSDATWQHKSITMSFWDSTTKQWHRPCPCLRPRKQKGWFAPPSPTLLSPFSGTWKHRQALSLQQQAVFVTQHLPWCCKTTKAWSDRAMVSGLFAIGAPNWGTPSPIFLSRPSGTYMCGPVQKRTMLLKHISWPLLLCFGLPHGAVSEHTNGLGTTVFSLWAACRGQQHRAAACHWWQGQVWEGWGGQC